MNDPVCKMPVNDKSAFRSEYKGKSYLFCSKQCKEKFDKSPEAYAR